MEKVRKQKKGQKKTKKKKKFLKGLDLWDFGIRVFLWGLSVLLSHLSRISVLASLYSSSCLRAGGFLDRAFRFSHSFPIYLNTGGPFLNSCLSPNLPTPSAPACFHLPPDGLSTCLGGEASGTEDSGFVPPLLFSLLIFALGGSWYGGFRIGLLSVHLFPSVNCFAFVLTCLLCCGALGWRIYEDFGFVCLLVSHVSIICLLLSLLVTSMGWTEDFELLGFTDFICWASIMVQS